jgi:hypothetical protein
MGRVKVNGVFLNECVECCCDSQGSRGGRLASFFLLLVRGGVVWLSLTTALHIFNPSLRWVVQASSSHGSEREAGRSPLVVGTDAR